MRRLLVLLVSILAAVGPTSALSAAGNPAAAFVLKSRDLGSAYTINAPFSKARTLREISTGASPSVKRDLAKKWVAGMQTGFNSLNAERSVVSTADVFRTSDLGAVVRSFQRRYLSLSRGKLSRPPAGAPGSNRFLIRGHMQSFVALLYVWQRGTKVLSVWQIATKASLRPHELFALARLQDAKAR
jgi:hypothetical protein